MTSAEGNVAAARRFTELLVSGNYDAVAEMIAPDFSVDDMDIPESTGADSFNEWMARWDAAWESWRLEDLEVRPLGRNRTLSLFRIIARGRGSGVELARDDAAIADFRDGRVVRIAYYNDQAQARADAGLAT